MSDLVKVYEATVCPRHMVIGNPEWENTLVLWDEPDGSLKLQCDDEEKRAVLLQQVSPQDRQQVADFVRGARPDRLAPACQGRLVLVLDVGLYDETLVEPGTTLCADVWFDGAGMVHALSGEVVSVCFEVAPKPEASNV